MLNLFTSHLYFGLAVYMFLIAMAALALRPDLWRPFAFMAAVGIALAPIQHSICLQDWYYPKFLFGWRPAFMGGLPWPPEDILFGAGITGLSALFYPLITRQRLQPGTHRPMPVSWQAAGVVISLTLLLAPFHLWGVHSFYTSGMACLYLATCVGYQRPDLLRPMAITATGITLIAALYYLIALRINPLWLQQEWFLQNLSGYQLANIPVEELLWYTYAGLVFSGLYPCRIGAAYLPRHAPQPSRFHAYRLTPIRAEHVLTPATLTLPSTFHSHSH